MACVHESATVGTSWALWSLSLWLGQMNRGSLGLAIPLARLQHVAYLGRAKPRGKGQGEPQQGWCRTPGTLPYPAKLAMCGIGASMERA